MIQNGNTGETIYLKDRGEIDIYIYKLNNIIRMAISKLCHDFIQRDKGDLVTNDQCH